MKGIVNGGKVFRALLVGLVAAFLPLSCGGKEREIEAKGEKGEVAIVLKTLANPFWVAMKEGIEEEARRLNVKVDVYAVQSEEDLQGQLQLFESVINKQYDGIGFAPLSPVNLIPAVSEAYRKGIPLVNIDERVDKEQLRNAGANVYAFVTTDNLAVGAKAAQFIVDKISTGGVAILEGKSGAASGEARRRGATEVFEEAPGVDLLASQPADWDRLKALDVASNILQRFPDIKAIYCANDTMALGAIQAIINRGKEGQILVVGTDGIDEAREMVSQGKLAATIGQDPAEVGAESLRQLVYAIDNNIQVSPDSEPRLVAVESQLISP